VQPFMHAAMAIIALALRRWHTRGGHVGRSSADACRGEPVGLLRQQQ
jgi:hypothetical protein